MGSRWTVSAVPAALLAGLLATSTVHAQAKSPVNAPVKSQANEKAAAAAATAFLVSEQREYEKKLTTLRGEYLGRASWAELGDRCNPGSLRVFAKDTTAEQQKALQLLVERMEQTVVARGAGASLAGAEARALLRVIVGWEAGIDRPRWDEDGSGSHMAVATGLTGEVPDPTSPSRCLPSPVMRDTVVFVVPGFTDMEFPKAPKPRVKAYLGASAQQRVRDEFFAAVGSKQPDAELSYIVIAPMVIWRGYALVGVNRPKERGGVELGSGSNGGAVYLLRRVGTEWRLLSVVRSWGS